MSDVSSVIDVEATNTTVTAPTALADQWRRRGQRALKRAARWWYRQLRRRGGRRWAARFGWDRPVTQLTFTSTRQAVALDPLLTTTRGRSYGHPFGTDLLTHQMLTGSPHNLYEAGIITAPIIVILGGVGTRKSSLMKTHYGLRALATGTRLAVFDRKVQREGATVHGEYHRLSRVVPGAETVVLHRDPEIGTRINILDPEIAAQTDEETVGQDELLRMVATAAMGRPLSPEEAYALAAAHRIGLARATAEGRVAVLSDVVAALYTPTVGSIPGPMKGTEPVLASAGIVDQTRVTEWGLPVALGLERFLAGDLSGLIDGETRGPDGRPINLLAPLLVIDTSTLPEGSVALDLMMAIFSTYLMNRWARVPGEKVLALEEAYSADELGAVSKVIKALVKRSRGVGAAVIAIMHHLSDLSPTSPLYSLIQEASIAHIFNQDKTQDAAQAVEMFNLPAEFAEVIQTLPAGKHVWVRGQNPRLPPTLARAFWTPLEAYITDTDEAMRAESPEAES